MGLDDVGRGGTKTRVSTPHAEGVRHVQYDGSFACLNLNPYLLKFFSTLQNI
jgi:hypothetical protein